MPRRTPPMLKFWPNWIQKLRDFGLKSAILAPRDLTEPKKGSGRTKKFFSMTGRQLSLLDFQFEVVKSLGWHSSRIFITCWDMVRSDHIAPQKIFCPHFHFPENTHFLSNFQNYHLNTDFGALLREGFRDLPASENWSRKSRAICCTFFLTTPDLE